MDFHSQTCAQERMEKRKPMKETIYWKMVTPVIGNIIHSLIGSEHYWVERLFYISCEFIVYL